MGTHMMFRDVNEIAKHFELERTELVWINRIMNTTNASGTAMVELRKSTELMKLSLLDIILHATEFFNTVATLDSDRLVYSKVTALRIQFNDSHWTLSPHETTAGMMWRAELEE